MPFGLGIFTHAASANFQNQLVSLLYGYDLVGSMTFDELSVYAGMGHLYARGRFMGGSSGVTLEGREKSEQLKLLRSFVGGSFQLSNYFVALEANRDDKVSYNVRLGLRF